MASVIIAGSPRSGKTTLADALAKRLGLTLGHTDDLVPTHGWSDASAEVAHWMAGTSLFRPGFRPSLIEGTTAIRAARKFMAADPAGKPCDLVVWMPYPRVPLEKPGQRSMAAGCLTVYNEILPQLQARGVGLYVIADPVVGGVWDIDGHVAAIEARLKEVR
jgi:hypothetical protein